MTQLSEPTQREALPETMQAVVCHGPEDYRLEEVPVPKPGKGEALVRVEAVGICASDLKCYHGAAKFWGDENRPAWAQTDVIPGHEFVGEVIELDDEATQRWGVAVGDRVVSEQIVPCWKCRYCQRGEYWMCAPHDMFGFRRRNPGGMASYMVYPVEALVYKISKDLPPAHAAFTEPLSCALHAVERASIKFEDVVVVAGCGPIGLGMIAGAAAKYPAEVIALDMSPAQAGARQEVRRHAHGQHRGAGPGAVRQGPDRWLRRRRLPRGHRSPRSGEAGAQPAAQAGRYVEYSVFGSDVTVDWSIISDDKELDVLGAHLGPHCWPAAIRMLESGRLPMEEICSHQLPLEEFKKGLDMVAAGTESIKVTLIPS